MQISDVLENLIINHLLRGQAHTPSASVYVGLFSDATTDAGGGTEAVGGSYARKAMTIGAPVAGAAENTNTASWVNMPAGTWTHAALITALNGGSFLFHGALTNPKTTVLGQALELAPGELDVGFTAASDATDVFRALIIDRFLRNQAFAAPGLELALYTSATDRSGGGAEVAGGGYARQAVTLVAAAGGGTSNAADVAFSNMPDQTADDVSHGAIHVAGGGAMWLQGALTTPLTPAAGDRVRFPTGNLSLAVR